MPNLNVPKSVLEELQLHHSFQLDELKKKMYETIAKGNKLTISEEITLIENDKEYNNTQTQYEEIKNKTELDDWFKRNNI